MILESLNLSRVGNIVGCVALAQRALADALTFADLVVDYLTDRRNLASVAEIERELRKDVLPTLGAKSPSQITAASLGPRPPCT